MLQLLFLIIFRVTNIYILFVEKLEEEYFFYLLQLFWQLDHVVPEIMIIITLWLSLQRFMGIGDLNLLLLREMGRKKVFNDECFRRSSILFNGADGRGVERSYESISTPGTCKDSGNLNFTFSVERGTIYQTYTNGQKDEARVEEVTNTTLVVSQNKTIDNIKVKATMKYIKA